MDINNTSDLVAQALEPLRKWEKILNQAYTDLIEHGKSSKAQQMIQDFEKLIDRKWDEAVQENGVKNVMELPREKYLEVCKFLGEKQTEIMKYLIHQAASDRRFKYGSIVLNPWVKLTAYMATFKFNEKKD